MFRTILALVCASAGFLGCAERATEPPARERRTSELEEPDATPSVPRTVDESESEEAAEPGPQPIKEEMILQHRARIQQHYLRLIADAPTLVVAHVTEQTQGPETVDGVTQDWIRTTFRVHEAHGHVDAGDLLVVRHQRGSHDPIVPGGPGEAYVIAVTQREGFGWLPYGPAEHFAFMRLDDGNGVLSDLQLTLSAVMEGRK